MLVDHVEAVLKVIQDGPCIFAGDFNTFTTEHHNAVLAVMTRHGFNRDIAVAYDSSKILDLVFSRYCKVKLIRY